MRFDEYRSFDAVGLAALVARGEVQPGELLDIALARSREVQPALGPISLLEEAHGRTMIEAGLPAGPFRGVPFLLKDLFAFAAGTSLTNGSRLFEGYVCPADSTLIGRFKAAGLVMFGKTVSPELGCNVTTEPVLHGPVRNPYAPDRTAGGSSGGSAVAVAAGIVPMAHGSDGGGSIRIPASACGLVGLKPSRGRMPVGPTVGEAWNGLAGGHVLTRSVRDSAVMLDAASGPEPGDPYACPPASRPFAAALEADPALLRVALVTGIDGLDAIDPACREAALDTARLLEGLGHHVEEAGLEVDAQRVRWTMETIVAANLAHDLAGWQKQLHRPLDENHLERLTLALLERGRHLGAADYAQALFQRDQVARAMGRLFERYDLLLTPTLGQPPVPLGWIDQNSEDTLTALDRTARFVVFPPLYNLSGCPAISLPLAWTQEGLPLGSMLGARLGGEETLLRVAAQLERARPWFDRVPAI